MKDDKEIIGYKAPFSFTGLSDYVTKGALFTKKVGEFFYHNDSNTKDNFRKNPLPSEIIEQWEPVYKSKYSLPRINGYDGKLIDDNLIKYGCAEFNINILDYIYSSSNSLGTRKIQSIKLDSGVEITINQIKQILDYVDNQ